jgi:anti-sigma factor RsiW
MSDRPRQDPTGGPEPEPRTGPAEEHSGEGPGFDPSWWGSYGKPAAILALGVLAVAGIIVAVLAIFGVLFD